MYLGLRASTVPSSVFAHPIRAFHVIHAFVFIFGLPRWSTDKNTWMWSNVFVDTPPEPLVERADSERVILSDNVSLLLCKHAAVEEVDKVDEEDEEDEGRRRSRRRRKPLKRFGYEYFQ